MNYFVLEHSDANTPSIYELRNKDGRIISVMEENNVLKEKLKNYKFKL